MSSFVVSKEDVKNFGMKPTLKNMSGIFYLYATTEEAVKNVLPPPLEFVAPAVIGYFVGFSHTTFGGPYTEFMIGTPASYKGQIGVYPLSLMLAGHGAEMAVKAGTNCVGFPKKIADDMQISRNGNEVNTKLVRHGVTIFECTVNIDGSYNTPDAEAILAINQPGDVVPGGYYIHHLNYMQTEQGNMEFKDVDLAMLLTEHTVKTFEPGKLADVKVRSSADDAYGEMVVAAPMAACYFETDGITMKATKHLESLNPEEALPYLMTARFDRGMMGDEIRYMTNFMSK